MATGTFVVSVCTTPLVTIAHQDDLYVLSYAEYMLERASTVLLRPSDLFHQYGMSYVDGEEVLENRLLKVKRRPCTASKPEMQASHG